MKKLVFGLCCLVLLPLDADASCRSLFELLWEFHDNALQKSGATYIEAQKSAKLLLQGKSLDRPSADEAWTYSKHGSIRQIRPNETITPEIVGELYRLTGDPFYLMSSEAGTFLIRGTSASTIMPSSKLLGDLMFNYEITNDLVPWNIEIRSVATSAGSKAGTWRWNSTLESLLKRTIPRETPAVFVDAFGRTISARKAQNEAIEISPRTSTDENIPSSTRFGEGASGKDQDGAISERAKLVSELISAGRLDPSRFEKSPVDMNEAISSVLRDQIPKTRRAFQNTQDMIDRLKGPEATLELSALLFRLRALAESGSELEIELLRIESFNGERVSFSASADSSFLVAKGVESMDQFTTFKFVIKTYYEEREGINKFDLSIEGALPKKGRESTKWVSLVDRVYDLPATFEMPHLQE